MVNASNVALPGASIIVKGTTTGTTADRQGNYRLNAPANATLVYSFVGYESQEVARQDRASATTTLKPAVQQLSKVVVTGYARDPSNLPAVAPVPTSLPPILLPSPTQRDGERRLDQRAKGYTIIEQMPDFPGGTEEMFKFLSRSVKYPPVALRAHERGEVGVTFVVNDAGEVEQATVYQSVSPALDAEALRVINAMPAWQPARQNGNAVALQLSLPIRFTID